MNHSTLLSETLARELVGRATLAPSSHNTQPWRFVASESCIEIWADRQRALQFNDPHHRELTISCGCALLNLRIAAEERGLRAYAKLIPSSHKVDLLASVTFSRLNDDYARVNLEAAIDKRHTYRRRYMSTPIAQSDIIELAEQAVLERAQLHHFADAKDRNHVESLVVHADTLQWSDPSWRKELASWVRSRKDGEGLTVPTLVLPVVRGVVRNIDLGGIVAKQEPDLAQMPPILLMIATETDTAIDWLIAGQALQRVLLTAALKGLQASYLNQAIQIQTTRPKVATLVVEGCCPQVLFRLGAPAQDVEITPRRKVSDTMHWIAPSAAKSAAQLVDGGVHA
jgi:hypothetical protein